MHGSRPGYARFPCTKLAPNFNSVYLRNRVNASFAFGRFFPAYELEAEQQLAKAVHGHSVFNRMLVVLGEVRCQTKTAPQRASAVC